MKINAIYENLYNRKNVNFKAHPDFVRLAKSYEITASSYFRRGQCYGSVCDKFVDVVDILKSVYKKIKCPKILIAGLGESQEPFSVLSVIKTLKPNKKISQVVKLNCVDMQSPIDKKTLLKQSYFDSYNNPPFYAIKGFTSDLDFENLFCREKTKICDEIFNFLNSVYNNKQKTKWNSRIQDVVTKYKKNSFDVISANNTLGYIEKSKEVKKTLNNFERILKPQGVLIIDPYMDKYYIDRLGCLKNFKKIKEGIFQK